MTLIERLAVFCAALIIIGLTISYFRDSGARLVTVHQVFASLSDCKDFVEKIPVSARRGDCE